MARDAEFWKTAGETGAGIVTFLSPIAGAAWLAVKKYRKDHPEEAKPPADGAPDPCADLKAANARLEHENARLCEAIERANDRADKADARAGRLQEWIDARAGGSPPGRGDAKKGGL